jgi:cation/acetate symporter
MAAAIFVAGWLGLNPPGFAAGTVALAFGIAASTIFPALMMGIFSKTVTDKGASAGMIAGLFVTLFYVFAHKGIFFIKGTEYLDMIGGANSFFTITPEAFGTVGAIVNFAVAYAGQQDGCSRAGAHRGHGGRRPYPQGCRRCNRPLMA